MENKYLEELFYSGAKQILIAYEGSKKRYQFVLTDALSHMPIIF